MAYHNLWHFKVDSHLRDGPHAHSRVQEKVITVDGFKKTNDGNAVPDRAVIINFSEGRDAAFVIIRVLFDNAKHIFIGLPLSEIPEAYAGRLTGRQIKELVMEHLHALLLQTSSWPSVMMEPTALSARGRL